MKKTFLIFLILMFTAGVCSAHNVCKEPDKPILFEIVDAIGGIKGVSKDELTSFSAASTSDCVGPVIECAILAAEFEDDEPETDTREVIYQVSPIRYEAPDVNGDVHLYKEYRGYYISIDLFITLINFYFDAENNKYRPLTSCGDIAYIIKGWRIPGMGDDEPELYTVRVFKDKYIKVNGSTVY